MRKFTNNPNGYKVCYKELGSNKYVRHYKTYTYRQAKQAIKGFETYDVRARDDNHILIKPKWIIVPIQKSEIRAGIWRECPF